MPSSLKLPTSLTSIALTLLLITHSQALTLPASDDTSTRSQSGNQILKPAPSKSSVLGIGRGRVALLRFQYNDINLLSLNAFQLRRAVLRFYVTSVPKAGSIAIRQITSAWSENSTGTAPTLAPGNLTTIPASQLKPRSFHSVELTIPVRNEIANGTNFGFAIEVADPADKKTLVLIGSKEGGSPAHLDIITHSDITGRSSNLLIGPFYGQNLTNSNFNTAVGESALKSLQNAFNNTAVGASALKSCINGYFNSAFGANSLAETTNGDYNTAIGSSALNKNSLGSQNTAIGYGALFENINSSNNVAIGYNALRQNLSYYNCAVGSQAAYNNTEGFHNIAVGYNALFNNLSGNYNVALGADALGSNLGSFNCAIGPSALHDNVNGNSNIALGYLSGFFITGNNNITIGNSGTSSDEQTIRIGAIQTKTFIAGIRGVTTSFSNAIPVLIDGAGQLGTINSSRKVKQDIRDIRNASDRIHILRPVSFRYRQPSADGSRPIEYGLIAEEVAESFPELVVRDASGQPETVKYHELPVLLLNEHIKAKIQLDELTQKRIKDAETIKSLESQNALLREKLNALESRLDELARKAVLKN